MFVDVLIAKDMRLSQKSDFYLLNLQIVTTLLFYPSKPRLTGVAGRLP